jgi:hypothetical protein
MHGKNIKILDKQFILGCTPLLYPAATEQNRKQFSKNNQQRDRDSKQVLLDHRAELPLHQPAWLNLI